MGNPITKEEILAGVANEHRHFFRVGVAVMPREMFGIVESFWTAVRCIAPAMWLSHPAHVMFSTAPFSVTLKHGELLYRTRSEVINAHVEHMVFLDCNKMFVTRPQMQVACILEELVHALMHISDEHLVSVVVASLYSGITFVDGKYHVVEPVVPA